MAVGDGRGMWLLGKAQRFEQDIAPESPAEAVELLPEAPSTREPAVSAAPAGTAQAIGGRYEQMNSALDAMARLLEQVRSIEPLLGDVRTPLAEEYETRRAEHAELVALRQTHQATETALQLAQDQERDALGKLTAAEMALGESEAVRASQQATIEERAIEVDRLRTELLQLQLRAQHLESALRDATGRNNEMEHDVASLRGHLEEVDRRRADAEAGLARATQDGALLGEELAVLKKRNDQTTAEITRLTRAEHELEAQLGAERARSSASEGNALAAQAEAARVIRLLETQLEMVRSDLAATQTRLETSHVRAGKLEELNGQLGTKLADVATRLQYSERLAAERQTILDRASERIRLLEEDGEALRQRHATVETARSIAVERADQLAKSLDGHERAVERAEARAAQSRTRLEKLMAGHDTALREQTQRIEAMQKEIERSRAEAALAEGALETVRRDRDRLQAALFGKGNGAG